MCSLFTTEPQTIFRKVANVCRSGSTVNARINSFFRRYALKEQFESIRKRPNTVRCLAVKRALLGTRHPRKEKEAALQNKIRDPQKIPQK